VTGADCLEAGSGELEKYHRLTALRSKKAGKRIRPRNAGLSAVLRCRSLASLGVSVFTCHCGKKFKETHRKAMLTGAAVGLSRGSLVLLAARCQFARAIATPHLQGIRPGTPWGRP